VQETGEVQGIYKDDVSNFDEIAIARGVLGRFPGHQIMGLVKKLMNTW